MIILLLLHYGEDLYSLVQLSAKVCAPLHEKHKTDVSLWAQVTKLDKSVCDKVLKVLKQMK